MGIKSKYMKNDRVCANCIYIREQTFGGLILAHFCEKHRCNKKPHNKCAKFVYNPNK